MLYYDKKHQTILEFYERNEEETWKFHDIIKVEKYQVQVYFEEKWREDCGEKGETVIRVFIGSSKFKL